MMTFYSLLAGPHGSRWPALLLAVPLALSCGCEDGDDSVLEPRCVVPSDAELVAFLGVYQMTEFTRNEQSCSAPGASVLADETEKFLYVARRAAPGTSELRVGSCETPAGCRDKINGLSASSYQRSFACSVGDGSLFGRSVTSAPFGTDGTCREQVSDNFLESLGADITRIESRTSIGKESGHDADGGCSSATAFGTGEAKPCAVLEIVTASLIEKL